MSSEVFIILAGPQPVPCSRRGGGSAPRAPPGAGNCPAPSFHGRRSSQRRRERSLVSLDLHLCHSLLGPLGAWLPSYHQLFPLCTWLVFLRWQVSISGLGLVFFLSDCNPILQIVYSLLQLDCIWHSDRYWKHWRETGPKQFLNN